MKSSRPFQTILRTLAAVLFVATLGTWIVTGAHRGWTKTTVSEMHTDEITGIEYPVERKAFIAGVEFLAVGVAGALLFGAASLIGGRRSAVRA